MVVLLIYLFTAISVKTDIRLKKRVSVVSTLGTAVTVKGNISTNYEFNEGFNEFNEYISI